MYEKLGRREWIGQRLATFLVIWEQSGNWNLKWRKCQSYPYIARFDQPISFSIQKDSEILLAPSGTRMLGGLVLEG